MRSDGTDHVPTVPTPDQSDDLGRRVRHWRERVGMTRQDLATRAGMPMWYLEDLEMQRTSSPSVGAAERLAAALNLPTAELLGVNVDSVSARAPARPSLLVEIGADRSWQLIGDSGVGRIVFDSEDGPVALPVNYVVSNHDILLRTNEDTVIAKIKADERVGFEVDHIDDAMSDGWSVVIQATCEHLGRARTTGVQVDPWAGGQRDHWIRLRSHSIVGRAITGEA
jgi:transcriptional regulator with XRE-family HTH domain